MTGQAWIMGRVIKEVGDDTVWEFMGVFDSEDSAKEQAINDSLFIAPVELNTVLPPEREDWEGLYYPLKEEE